MRKTDIHDLVPQRLHKTRHDRFPSGVAFEDGGGLSTEPE